MGYTYDENLFSDFHKEAYGFRPRESWWTWLETATPAEKQREWDSLGVAMQSRQAEEERMQEESVASFKQLLQTCIDSGAEDEYVALRWLVADQQLEHSQDIEHWVWKQGILFTAYGEEIMRKVTKIVETGRIENNCCLG